MAQPAAKVHRIGVLGNQNNPPWNGLRPGLRELGYVEGRNVTIEWRWSEGFTERLPAQDNVPAIILTVDMTAAVLSAAQAIGAPLLHKPMSPVKLRALLAQVLLRAGGRERVAA